MICLALKVTYVDLSVMIRNLNGIEIMKFFSQPQDGFYLQKSGYDLGLMTRCKIYIFKYVRIYIYI